MDSRFRLLNGEPLSFAEDVGHGNPIMLGTGECSSWCVGGGKGEIANPQREGPEPRTEEIVSP